MPLTIEASGFTRGKKAILDEIKKIRAGLALDKFREIARRAMDDYALLDLDPQIQRNLAGGILGRRTGQLATRTRVTKATITGRNVSMAIETNGIPYGLIHETGGTIRPKTKQFLTIPLPDAMTAAGVVRKSAGELQQNPSPFDTTFIHEGTIIGEKNDKLTPLFLLRKKAVIPERRWASRSVDETLNKLLDRLSKGVDTTLRGKL